MEEKELLEILKENPSKGLEIAISLYGGTVKWIVVKILGSRQEQNVEDCVADTFVNLWQNLSGFDESRETSLKSYLYGIARYTALNFKRREIRNLQNIPFEEEFLTFEPDFEDEFAQKVNAQILQDAIDNMPMPDKTIFLLRYYLDEGVGNITERLNIPKKTVENKLYRGRQALKIALTERGIIR